MSDPFSKANCAGQLSWLTVELTTEEEIPTAVSTALEFYGGREAVGDAETLLTKGRLKIS